MLNFKPLKNSVNGVSYYCVYASSIKMAGRLGIYQFPDAVSGTFSSAPLNSFGFPSSTSSPFVAASWWSWSSTAPFSSFGTSCASEPVTSGAKFAIDSAVGCGVCVLSAGAEPAGRTSTWNSGLESAWILLWDAGCVGG